MNLRRNKIVQLRRPPVQAPPVLLQLDASAPANDAPVWIQVAAAGEFRGHASGVFNLDQEAFDEIVRNFRAHPAYRRGPMGVGDADVIPFDFHHASEKDASAGDIATVGAPAQAWAQELEVRQGVGGPELWALTRYLEPARTYVREGKYKWTSVAIWPDSADPVTGKSIGWYLSSIAFTNDPFIQGMQPIAATGSRGASQALQLGYYLDPYNPSKTVEDVVCALRAVLGLDKLAELSTIMGELAKLRGFALAPETAPPGVEIAELVGTLRILLNLPTLSDASVVFAELDKLLAAITASTPSTTLERKDHPMKLLIALAGRFHMPATAEPANEEKVLERVLLELEGAEKTKQKLTALLGALGIENPDAAVARVAELIKSAADLEAVYPELKELREAKEKTEEAAAEGDVEEVMATRKFPEEARVALAHYRKADPKGFAAKYPKLSAQERSLLNPLVTEQPNASGGITASRSGGAPLPPPRLGEGKVTLAAIHEYPGETDIERACAFVKAEAEAKKITLSWEDTHERAVKLLHGARSQHVTRL